MELESDEEEKGEENGGGQNGDSEERSHIMEELWAEGNPFRTTKTATTNQKNCLIKIFIIRPFSISAVVSVPTFNFWVFCHKSPCLE